ncbi:MAG: hypothetical protein KBG84_15660, partial [Planctomycetes bacterium]|nr:hypothetical protein [Planctomycetota bacterium]
MTKFAFIALFFVAFAGVLSAQAQERMRFQGRMTNAASVPITTSTSVAFNLYNTPTGGTALWTETHSGGNAITPSANGIFTVELGAITPITGVDFSQAVYLGITVGTDAEMTPRHLFTASGLAHHAKNAALLGGLARTGFAELTGATFTGPVSATTFTGSGSGLTGIPASQLTGTLPALDGSTLTNVNASTLGGLARTGFAELTGATFTGGVTATVFSGSGSGLTSIPASQLTGALPALDGSALTALNATALTSGTLPDGRLTGTYTGALTFSNITSANMGTLNATDINVSNLIKLGNSAAAATSSNAGSLRWNGTKVQYSNGTAWEDIGSTSGNDVTVYA